MSSQYQRMPKATIWPIEPKAPSLVSLSVRDQNIQRPPKRSSSFRFSASGLKKGFSSHHLLNGSAHDNLKSLRRGKHSSCSSLHVKKNRSKAPAIHLTPVENERDEDNLCDLSIDINSSNDTLPEIFEPQWNIPCQTLDQVATNHLLQNGQSNSSSETVIRSKGLGEESDSSGRSNSTFHTTLQARHHSARQLITKVMGTMQKRRRGIERFIGQDATRVEAWVEKTNAGVPSVDARYTRSSAPPRIHTGRGHERMTSAQERLLNRLDELPDEVLFPDPVLAPDLQQTDLQRSVSWAPSGSTFGNEQMSPLLRLPVRLRITAKAEITEATVVSNEAVWAIIQMHAELPEMPLDTVQRRNAIAIAVVVDNSRLATRKDVKKMCLEVMSLASSLEEGVDHLGVYCTSAITTADICVCSVAVPLSSIQLRAKLDEVSHRPRNNLCIQEAYLQAAQALRTLRSQVKQAGPQVAEDLVVISSSALGLPACFQQNMEGLRVHMVNPSLIPYSDKVRRQLITMRATQLKEVRGFDYAQGDFEQGSNNNVNGWLIDSTRCLSSDCDDHRSHSLVDAIRYSKFQANAGSISNLSVTIQEREGARIEQVVGDLSYATLLPGQMVSIPIRVQLNSLGHRFSIGADSVYDNSTSHSIANAISELELTLGNHLSELFEVKITYNHSFFPKNTRLEVRESCWLTRTLLPGPAEVLSQQKNGGLFLVKRNTQVQKQLALSKAASNLPAVALRSLEELGPETMTEGVSSFLDALKQRLKHRVALSKDVSLIDHLLAPEFIEKSPPTYKVNIALEEYLKELPDPLHLNEDDGTETPATMVWRNPQYSENPVEADEGEARKIWQRIRRTSRRDKPSRLSDDKAEKDSIEQFEQYDPQIEEIIETALRHGRKMSSATLKSLIKDMRRDSSLMDEGVAHHDFD